MELFDHQKQAVQDAYARPAYALYFEQGTGKTCTVLNIINRKMEEELKTPDVGGLIICPLITISNWKREMEKFNSYLKFSSITINQKTGPKKLMAIKMGYEQWEAPTFILNYETLFIGRIFDYLSTKKFDFIILDESQKIKNPDAKRTKKIIELGKLARFRYILSGTPILNRLTDVHSQFEFLDQNQTFGPLKEFQKEYFIKNLEMVRVTRTEKRNTGRKTKVIKRLIPKVGAGQAIRSKIEETGMIIKKEECLDLPPLIVKPVYFEMPDKARDEYLEVQKGIIELLKGEKHYEIMNILARIMKLQQVSSGWLKDDDGNIHELDHTRQQRLIEILHLLQDRNIEKLLIWTVFVHDYQVVKNACNAVGYSSVLCTGQQNNTQKDQAVAEFMQGDANVFIGNPQSAGIGINLTVANVAIIYNRSFRLEDLLQAQARCHRIGSEVHDKVVQIDLIAENTIDEEIFERLNYKKKISDSVLVNYFKI